MRLAAPIALSIGVFVLDQATKRLAEAVFSESMRAIAVAPFFNLVLSHNRGISFGLLRSDHAYAPYVLVFVALTIVAGLSVWLWRSDSAIERLALSAILGGAVGNVVDRLEDGAVTDFLDFYIEAYHWPAFNLADTAIFCGVVALLLASVWPRSAVPKSDAANDRK